MSIINSITSLATNLRFRRTSDINREIIEAMTKKSELEMAGANDAIIAAYSNIIVDLKLEKEQAQNVDRQMVINLNVTFDTTFNGSENDNNASDI